MLWMTLRMGSLFAAAVLLVCYWTRCSNVFRAPKYALSVSTMIPSLVNLVIAGTSLVRGLPGVPSLLLRFMPERGTMPKFERAWIATVLTTHVAASAALGIAAQVFLVVVIIGYVMPFFGLELLDMARGVAAFDLPARVGQLFGIILQPAALLPSPLGSPPYRHPHSCIGNRPVARVSREPRSHCRIAGLSPPGPARSDAGTPRTTR
jgi:hypothetical protein